MESELEKVNKELKNHKLNEFASGCDKAGQKMESFGKKMSVVSAGIAAIGAASIAAFKELDEGYDTIVTKTGATGEALEGLTASADNVFGSMPEDMSTVGEAIGEVNTRFHSTGEELESLSTQFIQFSSINGTNVTQSVDQVDKIMKAWNIDTSQTGNLLGLLTSKAQETGISVDKLESYVLDNNSAFKEMGLSLPQAINLMAQFDANGVDSTTALAGLKKALQNATAEGKSMDVALEETIGSIKNAKTDTEALQIATELFGKKGAAEMATAIRENRIDLTKEMISNCGHDERGKYSGGKAGDQTGTEWQVINWYNRPWKCVLRHPDAATRKLIAQMAKAAAVNNMVGYCQSHRGTFWTNLADSNFDPAQITVPCEADCSSGVAAIVKGAGYRLKNEKLKNVSTACYTGNLRAALKAAGFEVLTDKKYLTSDAYLLEGDILLNDGAHVATNLTNGAKASGGGASQTVPINSNVKLETAKGFNKSLAGTYKVTGAGALNLRSGAGTGKDKKVLTTMQSGETCQCYGYYTDVSGVKWLYVAYKNVVGFASSKYLKK